MIATTPTLLPPPLFRLGATSFVFPAGWADNVERLCAETPVRDVELLFFEAERPEQLPNAAECARLIALKDRHQLSYTLHTPLGASLASADAGRRADALALVRRCLEVARPLQPERIVVHVYHGDQEHDPAPPLVLEAWRARAAEALAAIVALDVPARALCVETIDYDFALLGPVIEALDLSVALDVGHQLRDGRDELALLDRWLSRTGVVQWHGVEPGGRDHRSIVHCPRERSLALLRALRRGRFTGVLTLEVFRPDDLRSSLAEVEALTAALEGQG
ncbi:MAG TPA: cobamide remodeling phosphodiesterase CbiR [Polyangia bacterium]|jgi:sugar phosphate isomerase/epimerase